MNSGSCTPIPIPIQAPSHPVQQGSVLHQFLERAGTASNNNLVMTNDVVAHASSSAPQHARHPPVLNTPRVPYVETFVRSLRQYQSRTAPTTPTTGRSPRRPATNATAEARKAYGKSFREAVEKRSASCSRPRPIQNSTGADLNSNNFSTNYCTNATASKPPMSPRPRSQNCNPANMNPAKMQKSQKSVHFDIDHFKEVNKVCQEEERCIKILHSQAILKIENGMRGTMSTEEMNQDSWLHPLGPRLSPADINDFQNIDEINCRYGHDQSPRNKTEVDKATSQTEVNSCEANKCFSTIDVEMPQGSECRNCKRMKLDLHTAKIYNEELEALTDKLMMKIVSLVKINEDLNRQLKDHTKGVCAKASEEFSNKKVIEAQDKIVQTDSVPENNEDLQRKLKEAKNMLAKASEKVIKRIKTENKIVQTDSVPENNGHLQKHLKDHVEEVRAKVPTIPITTRTSRSPRRPATNFTAEVRKAYGKSLREANEKKSTSSSMSRTLPNSSGADKNNDFANNNACKEFSNKKLLPKTVQTDSVHENDGDLQKQKLSDFINKKIVETQNTTVQTDLVPESYISQLVEKIKFPLDSFIGTKFSSWMNDTKNVHAKEANDSCLRLKVLQIAIGSRDGLLMELGEKLKRGHKILQRRYESVQKSQSSGGTNLTTNIEVDFVLNSYRRFVRYMYNYIEQSLEDIKNFDEMNAFQSERDLKMDQKLIEISVEVKHEENPLPVSFLENKPTDEISKNINNDHTRLKNSTGKRETIKQMMRLERTENNAGHPNLEPSRNKCGDIPDQISDAEDVIHINHNSEEISSTDHFVEFVLKNL